MRHVLSSVISVAFLVCACGGGDALPPSIDGTWSATAQVSGSGLAISLKTQDSVVSGAGVYSIADGRSGVLAVAGTYQPPAVLLTFNYDSGDTALFTASVVDGDHMNGRLIYKDGASVDLGLVRR